MSTSLKITHVLLAAAFAAGLSACSADESSSASATTPVPSASPAAPESTPVPAVTVTAPAEPSSPAVSTDSPTTAAEPTADTRGDGAGDTGPAVYLLGPLGASPGQPGWITVQTGDGDAQSVMLSPDATVLDARGTICTTGQVPHRCTAAQLEKALNARKPLNAKVMLQGGVAVKIEATTGR